MHIARRHFLYRLTGRRICPDRLVGWPTPTDLGSDSDLEHRVPYLTGFPLASPPGTPTPDPARIVGVIDLVVVVIAALALYVYHLAHAWRGIYVVTIPCSPWYSNAFVAVAQAFQKVGFLHALAPTGKEPPFLVAQLLTLALFVAISVVAFKRLPGRTATEVI